jgi:hypothetical protein
VQSKNEDSERALPVAETAAAAPLEPTFLLRGSDPVAYLLTLVWACIHKKLGTISEAQAVEAMMTGSAMEQWARTQGLNVDRALQVWAQVLGDAGARLRDVGVERLPPGQRLQ